MKIVFVSLLIAVALAQPRPANCTAKAACDTVTQRICHSGDDHQNCMSCAYQHKNQYDDAGCDLYQCREEIQETCADCDKKCLPQLSTMCQADLDDTEQCLHCVNEHSQDLQKAGCNVGECRRSLYELCGYDPACGRCQQEIHQLCRGKVGSSCEDCVGEHTQQMARSCPLQTCAKTIESVCKAPEPSKTNCTQCAADLVELCPHELGKGRDCYECLEKNAGDLMKKGCNLREPECMHNLRQACGHGDRPDPSHQCGNCDDQLKKYCEDKEGIECLDCMGDNVAHLNKAHCNMRQCGQEIEKQCNAHPPADSVGTCSGCVADTHQYCPLGQNTTVHQCFKCIADHAGEFLYAKCDIMEYNCGRAIYNACRGGHGPTPDQQCSECTQDFKKACANTVGNQEQCTECIEQHYAAWNKDGKCNVQHCIHNLNRMCQKHDATRVVHGGAVKFNKVPMRAAKIGGGGH